MTAIGGPPWRHGRDIDWRLAPCPARCTAWIADEYASAECALSGPHELHEGPHEQRPGQIVSWYDTDPGARPSLPTGPAEVCS